MFNPAMLTLGREAEGLTQTALAHRVGVSQAFVSQVEHGFKHPTDGFVERVAADLNRPYSFFTDDAPILGDGIIDFFHKKRLTLPVKPLRHAHAVVNTLRLEVDRLLRKTDLAPRNQLPELDLATHGTTERIAELVRASWRLPDGPIGDLTALVESAGIPVLTADLVHRKLFAVTVPLSSGNHLIVLNARLAASAQRIALAHEVGHLSMHGVPEELGSLEAEADDFAGSLLMPDRQVARELRGLRFEDLGRQKARWRVPMKALVYRARKLGAVHPDQATMLYKRLSALPGGPLREPGEFEPEVPRLMATVIRHYVDKLDYSASQIAEIMKCSEGHLRSFYLGEEERPQLRVVSSERPTINFPEHNES